MMTPKVFFFNKKTTYRSNETDIQLLQTGNCSDAQIFEFFFCEFYFLCTSRRAARSRGGVSCCWYWWGGPAASSSAWMRACREGRLLPSPSFRPAMKRRDQRMLTMVVSVPAPNKSACHTGSRIEKDCG